MTTDKLQLLLVEDDLDLATAVIEYFELEDILCDHSANGLAGLNLIQQNHYDAVILDLNLPKMNGLQVCESLRSQGIDVPVLMLTARDTLDDKLSGFANGTDDYLVKPFAMEELIVRVKVLARRRSGQVQRLSVADLTVDVQQKQAFRQTVELKLSPTALKILTVLMRASPSPVSREKLMQTVWGDEQPDSNSLKVHIFNLRKQVDAEHDHKLLHTISGYGFAIKESHSS
ncbi:response regulator transcription factor [Shewanella ulleungensis]|uniref:DNA-binding response regulator n=1 Tax=Shewanella ulleungensis TaxID=2282699 RepID=A0ABQ2QQA0_9GAMM|nr:response regulator transcription factor [Shewanella ulleungensis]MCL1150279.1 response regulator transcription factor [Shewanella ulleungensis]GGP88586.1 DNA-binding response regulator [Shewanella ulleungensis]